MDRAEVYFGLGSNIEPREEHLAFALEELRTVGRISGVSTVYESDPVGYLDQGPFLNMVVHLETGLSPGDLMERIRTIEHAAGRVRTVAQGPRTLDVDLLLYDRRILGADDSPSGLEVPHPRMTERTFVLVPLLELDEALTDPRTGRPYTEYLRELVEADAGATDPAAVGLRRVLDGEELSALRQRTRGRAAP